jgi:ssRNA-specific RNase YbeY (16S rRNA maturation enzyme)
MKKNLKNKNISVSFAIVGPKEIKKLNSKYRKRNYPTGQEQNQETVSREYA